MHEIGAPSFEERLEILEDAVCHFVAGMGELHGCQYQDTSAAVREGQRLRQFRFSWNGQKPEEKTWACQRISQELTQAQANFPFDVRLGESSTAGFTLEACVGWAPDNSSAFNHQ